MLLSGLVLLYPSSMMLITPKPDKLVAIKIASVSTAHAGLRDESLYCYNCEADTYPKQLTGKKHNSTLSCMSLYLEKTKRPLPQAIFDLLLALFFNSKLEFNCWRHFVRNAQTFQ